MMVVKTLMGFLVSVTPFIFGTMPELQEIGTHYITSEG